MWDILEHRISSYTSDAFKSYEGSYNKINKSDWTKD